MLGQINAHADVLECSSDFAVQKVEINLDTINGKPVILTACTDAADWILGRAYIEWETPTGKPVLTELDLGGCGSNAVHAIRDNNEIMISFHSCQSREYHPKPQWFITLLRFNETKTDLLVVKNNVKL